MADIKGPISTQPVGTAPMSAGGNKNALNRPIGPDGYRDWSFGLLDCFSACGVCCLSCWCPCIAFSKNKQRLQSLQQHGTPLPDDGDTFDGYCCIYGLLGGNGWILQIQHRAEVRQRYGIRGGAGSDCFSAMCCRSCALTQERREIELEENSLRA